MARRLGLGGDISYDVREEWDPNELLHPAQAFEHPSHVVNDPDLTLNEKRAVLASWASDACALEAAPHLRSPPGGKQPVLFDEVMEALRTLDKQANEKDSAHYRRLLRRGQPRTTSASPFARETLDQLKVLPSPGKPEGRPCGLIVTTCPNSSL